MKLKLYQVDAFASRVFEGNPAAVVPLKQWLGEDLLQKIAEENNLSETVFIVEQAQGVEIRWFTPVKEVALCGHATLAAAHVLYKHLGYEKDHIEFSSKSGTLLVAKTAGGYAMDFPATRPTLITPPANLIAGLNGTPHTKVMSGYDYIIQLADETAVRSLKPDFTRWMALDLRGVIVTAQGDDVDFVSRCFFPKLRVNEDPITGSAHCELAPYWHTELNQTEFIARQLSPRSGLVGCKVNGNRVILNGTAIDYLQGEISL